MADQDDLDPGDLKVEAWPPRENPGGQQVGMPTTCGVRITHLPTGIYAIAVDQRSQHANKTEALRILRTKLLGSRPPR